MKANELRIGNWVSQYDFEFKITLNDFAKPNLNPIPLTEEWLLKFGFDFEFENDSDIFYEIKLKLGNTYLLIGTKGHYWIKYDTGNGFDDYVSIGLGQSKYVHQLQNLYFTLTGEELNEQLICDVCKGVGTRNTEGEIDDCWFCNGTGEELKTIKR